jgi:endonuclease YncB( thermonuclease family)
MVRVLPWVLALAAGCYTPPDLPLLERVPIEGPDFVPCADDVEDTRIDCVLSGGLFDIDTCLGGDEVRHRMIGVEVPEDGDCFGDSASGWLSDTLEGEIVTLTFDTVCVDESTDTKLAYVWARGDLYEDLARDRVVEDLTRDFGDDDEPAVMINEVALRLGYGRVRDEEIGGGAFYDDDFESAAASAEADRLGLFLACGAEG